MYRKDLEYKLLLSTHPAQNGDQMHDAKVPSELPMAEADLAASIVDAWSDLDRRAEAENPAEFEKAHALFALWAGKLEALLKGKSS